MTRQAAKLAAAARAQVQQEMKYKEEVRVPAATAKTVAFKKRPVAILAQTILTLDDDEEPMLEDCILPASPPPPKNRVSLNGTRKSPRNRITEVISLETPSSSPKIEKRVSDDPVLQVSTKIARTVKKPGHAATNRSPSKLAPVEEWRVVPTDELIEMELRSCISEMSLKDRRGLVAPNVVAKKRVTNSNTFEKACQLAAKDPSACAKRLIQIAKGNVEALVEFASIIGKDPVGMIGSRRQLRVAAMQLLDKVLQLDENHTIALCMKGEMLMPRQFFGTGHPNTPYCTLELAYAYFAKADMLGSREGRFQRGRWLVAMAPVHKSDALVREGMQYVDEAAKAGHARAYVFKAQVLEFPDRYALKGRKAKSNDNEMVVKWYLQAAEMGDGNAMNDIGSSYATKFGGLPFDFDEAVRYYVRAIKAGCLTAFENLGTHFETGMGGNAPDRVDLAKAMHYYQCGMEMRCCKCTFNIASAYEEGLGTVVQKDWEMAEKYYRLCILLAYDDEDDMMRVRAERALVALYICRYKLSEAGSKQAKSIMKKLNGWLNRRMLTGTMMEVNKCLGIAMDSRELNQLEELLGIGGAGSVYDAALLLGADASSYPVKDELSADIKQKLKHMFGTSADNVENMFRPASRTKRRRVSS